MNWTPDDCETAARCLLQEAGLDRERYVDPLAMFSALGIRIVAGTPVGCLGAIDFGEHTVYLPSGGTPGHRTRVASHELGHLALSLHGVRTPHDETAADLAGLMVRFPRAGIARVISACGGNPIAIARSFPEASAREVFTRMQMVGWF